MVRSFQSFIHYSRYLSNSNTHSELSEIEVKKVGSFDSHNVIEAIPNHSQLKTQSRQHANAVENRKKRCIELLSSPPNVENCPECQLIKG